MNARAFTIYNIWTSNLSTPDVQAVETEMSPKLAEFQDKIAQNPKLFARIDTLYKARDTLGLTPEQKQLVWVYWANGVKQGAQLNPAAKAQGDRDQPGSWPALYTAVQPEPFGRRIRLRPLPEGQTIWPAFRQALKDAAANAAADKGRKGEYAILNTRSSMDPFLTYSDRRDLREKVWRTFYNRGDNKDVHDNTKVDHPTRSSKLRYEKAKLMGYPNYAAWKLQDEMAKTPENAMAPDDARCGHPPSPASIEEVTDMQAVADAEHPQGTPGAIKIEGVGLPLLRREGEEGEVRPGYESGEAVPAARQGARRHVLGRRPALRLHLHQGGRRSDLRPRHAGL